MRTTLLRPAWLLMAALLLVACTRDRPTPEPTPTAAAAVTPVSASPSKADPIVETTGTTPSAEPETTAETTLTPEATSTKKTFDYTVKPGDTLADIAEKFQTSVQTLSALNFLLDDNIFSGQVLAVPYKEGMTAEGAPTPTPTPFTYVVQAGDSLSSIAIQFDIKSITLIEVNNIADPNNLAVGSELLIPGYVAPATIEGEPNATSGDTTSAATGDTGSATTTTTGGASNGGEAVVHVVQPGETMGQIAAEYGVDAAAISAANGIANGNLIRAGQKLTIPGITKQGALEARGERHIVQSGESLSGIAQQYGVSMEAILAANSLDDPNKIVVGQELLIPPQE